MSRDAVALVVVTYHSAAVLPDFFAALPAALEGVSEHRVVIVDNASTVDPTGQVHRLCPEAEVVRLPANAGYAAGINAGARVVDAEWHLLVLNPDIRLAPGAVRRLLDAAQDTAVGAVAPRLYDADGELAHSLRRDPSVTRVWAEAVLGGRRAARLGLSEVVSEPGAYQEAHDVDWASGAALLITPRCRALVGDWDETFFLYSEEVDFARRVRAAGLTVRYLPGAEAVHLEGEYGGNPELWRLLVANKVADFARHHTRPSRALFRAGVATGELLRARPGAKDRPAHQAGWRAALGRGRSSLHPAVAAPEDPEPGPGFIWFAAQDWWYHNQAHSDFQLMREVARVRPVLVVNSLGLRMPRRGTSEQSGRRILRKLRSTAKLLRRPLPDNPDFHVLSPLILPLYGDTRGARLNAWLIRQQVRLTAAAIGLGPQPLIGVTIPSAWPVVRPMSRSALVFNRADLHSAFPEADRAWVESLETALLTHSDVVLYVSHELMRTDATLVGDRAHFLDHGVDLEHFTSPVEEAAELAGVPRPRAGFFGGIDDYVVDLDLVRRTAEANPGVQVVLVGDATCAMDDLTALPNVHWFGYQPYARIPSFGVGFDVALMPWLDNEWIRYANPIKLKEYLALGLPVVSTAFPEVDDYRDLVHVADDRAGFPALVAAALAEAGDAGAGDAGARRARVRAYSWTARAAALCRAADAIGDPAADRGRR